MKHILAENMLRFGVKNLSESNIKNLQEAEPTPPASSATTPTQPTTPPANQRFESTFNVRQNNKDVAAKVVGFATKRPDGSFAPGSITLTYPHGGSGNTYIGFRNVEGTYVINPMSGAEIRKPSDIANAISEHKFASIAKGILPVTALKQVIANISKATKVSLKLDPAVEQAMAINHQNSAVSKTIPGKPTGLLAPFKTAGLVLRLNPETGTEMYRELWLGGSNMYSYAKWNGKVVPNGAERANDFLKLDPAKQPELNQAITDLYNQLDAAAGPAPKQ